MVSLSTQFSYADNFCVSEDRNMVVLVQFRLVQWEHGGGYCNCWRLMPGGLLVEAEGNSILPVLRLRMEKRNPIGMLAELLAENEITARFCQGCIFKSSKASDLSCIDLNVSEG